MEEGIKNGEMLKHESSHVYVDKLPRGCFDTIDGYYDPKKHTVFSYVTDEEIRVPEKEEIEWIKANCRVGQ
jgi:hypothetical protein